MQNLKQMRYLLKKYKQKSVLRLSILRSQSEAMGLGDELIVMNNGKIGKAINSAL